jgi:prefoldin subunit 5
VVCGVQKGRALVQRLQAVQEENMQLTSQLQMNDELLTQLDLRTAELEALKQTSTSQRAQLRALEGQVEDLVAIAASLQVRGLAPVG